jgi:hypothetical protein
MFEQTFKNADDILHKDAGCRSELDVKEFLGGVGGNYIIRDNR